MSAEARGRAIAEALFSTEEGPPARDRLDALEKDLADFLEKSDALARLVLGVSMWLVVALAPIAIGRLSFARMKADDRVRALARFETSFLGPLFLACKAILCILYFEMAP